MKRLHIIAHGRVQGVGYRASVFSRISKLAVTGYVKNLSDGTVEIVVEGSESSLGDVLSIAEEGSMYGSVSRLDVEYLPVEGGFTDFSIIR